MAFSRALEQSPKGSIDPPPLRRSNKAEALFGPRRGGAPARLGRTTFPQKVVRSKAAPNPGPHMRARLGGVAAAGGRRYRDPASTGAGYLYRVEGLSRPPCPRQRHRRYQSRQGGEFSNLMADAGALRGPYARAFFLRRGYTDTTESTDARAVLNFIQFFSDVVSILILC